ncbi:MAG: hypothetical protein ACFBSE_02020 [Prochloraceae cyanobacterium]
MSGVVKNVAIIGAGLGGLATAIVSYLINIYSLTAKLDKTK